MTRVGLVGLGYWGPNLARNFDALPGAELAWLCDGSQDAVDRWSAAFPHAQVISLGATALTLAAFQDNLIFFRSPSDVAREAPPAKLDTRARSTALSRPTSRGATPKLAGSHGALPRGAKRPRMSR